MTKEEKKTFELMKNNVSKIIQFSDIRALYDIFEWLGLTPTPSYKHALLKSLERITRRYDY